jgi:dienelactone hydrolase
MTRFWRPDIHPEEEPNRVLIERGQWVDENRDGRIVPYKIYYPDIQIDKPLPIILWSHGLGGTQDGAGFISRFLTSHGYIHVNIGHEGTNDSLWRAKPGHPWDNIRKAHIPWETILDRYHDIPFVLDRLHHLGLPVAGDFQQIGMSGHSMGALTTQIMAGQLTGKGAPISLKNNRFVAAIAYSPVPNVRLRPEEATVQEIYGDITVPMLHITGTEDHSPIDGPIQHLRDELYDIAGGGVAKQMQVILDGADHMVFNGSRGQLPDYDGMDMHKDQIKITALAWWDKFLKNDALADQWLRNNVSDYLGESSIVKVKNND